MEFKKKELITVLSAVMICVGAACQKEAEFFDRQSLHDQAVEESLIPVRPGIPGESPFWNINSSRFIYVPSFNFNSVKGAVKYRFTAISEADKKEYVFEANRPWVTLNPIWKELPVGYASLKVEGLDGDGRAIGTAGTREFYRAAVFDGPYREPVRDYRESARLGLQYLFKHEILRSWITRGKPDPRYSLYCYPSKMISAVISAMLLYATIAPEDAEEALLIAQNAAKYLISVSEPEGAPLEFFPPTYDAHHIDTTLLYEGDFDYRWAEKTVAKYDGQVMLIYPAGVANAYLDLYDRTGYSTFLEAAKKIADTYAGIQLPNGNWPLKMYIKTGEPVVENYARLARIIPLFRRLEEKYGIKDYRDNLALAQPHLDARMEDFNFEGQFEDIEPSKAYMNLAHGTALEIARKLLETAGEHPENAARIEELLRFAEDQFVVWERPIPKPRPDGDEISDDWLTPCALEQFECYCPVDASAASFISIFRKAYEVTGKKIYLAKAVSLANSMTAAQDAETGRYPTWWEDDGLDAPGWINCAIYDARVMHEFGKMTVGKDTD